MSLNRFFRKISIPAEEAESLLVLEKRIGYHFRDLSLLKQALSHKSYINEKRLPSLDHNERLEFLGDAVLELGVSDLLISNFPQSREGEMSKLRAALVNETALATQARNLELGRFIFLGKGEEQGAGREKNSLLSDAFEAMLGAIYVDGGFKPAYKTVCLLFLPEINNATKTDITQDFKTKLQEKLHGALRVSPDYRIISENGPDHDKTFEIHLYVNGEKWGEGQGKSKKQAEQQAAKIAYERLQLESNLSQTVNE